MRARTDGAALALPLPRPLTGPTPRGVQALVLLAVVPLSGLALLLALTGDHVEKPLATGLYRAYLIAAPALIGWYWWRKRPASRFGPLLVVFAAVACVYSWQSSDVPLLFTLGVLAEGPGAWLTFYLFLAFPMGRLQGWPSRALLGGLAVMVVGLFVPWVVLTPTLTGTGPLSVCVSACPDNALQVAAAPEAAAFAIDAVLYGLVVVGLGIAVVFAHRLLRASRPQRRSLTAVASTSLLFLPAFVVFHLSYQLPGVDPATREVLGWSIVVTRVLLPLGFLAALWQAQYFAGAALAALIRRLASRPTPEQWRDDVARALDDDRLEIGYVDPRSGRPLNADGCEIMPPPTEAGRTWLDIERPGGERVAAMVVDDALCEDPELVGAATAATLVAIENGHLEGEARASRARIVEAANAARRRVERDLHDSAQQRLVSLRIHLGLLSDDLAEPEHREAVERLGEQTDLAIEELRDIAHGIYPQVLTDLGLAAALSAASRGGALDVTVHDENVRRRSESVELAVYFCCLEALQNAAKHAGSRAVATVRLGERDGALEFTVEDDGVGFDPLAASDGQGLIGIADRAAALGGAVRVDSRPGHGTRVVGRIPFG